MSKLRLIRYFGGKVSMLRYIVPLMDTPHKHYVEVFGGGAGVLLNKKPSLIETYNDLDEMVVNLFRVVRDSDKFEVFKKLVLLTPYSRRDWIDYCANCMKEPDEIHKAFQFYYAMNLSFSGRFAAGFSTAVTTSSKNIAGPLSSYLAAVEKLDRIHARIMSVQIEQQDWRTILERYDTDKTLFYLDPPYIPETRRSGEYLKEISRRDHRELVRKLLKIKGKAILSGYDNPIYKSLERKGWKTIKIDRPCTASSFGKTRSTRGKVNSVDVFKVNRREEVLWLSPNMRHESAGVIGGFLK